MFSNLANNYQGHWNQNKNNPWKKTLSLIWNWKKILLCTIRDNKMSSLKNRTPLKNVWSRWKYTEESYFVSKTNLSGGILLFVSCASGELEDKCRSYSAKKAKWTHALIDSFHKKYIHFYWRNYGRKNQICDSCLQFTNIICDSCNPHTLQKQPVLWNPLNWFQHVMLQSQAAASFRSLQNKIKLFFSLFHCGVLCPKVTTFMPILRFFLFLLLFNAFDTCTKTAASLMTNYICRTCSANPHSLQSPRRPAQTRDTFSAHRPGLSSCSQSL